MRGGKSIEAISIDRCVRAVERLRAQTTYTIAIAVRAGGRLPTRHLSDY